MALYKTKSEKYTLLLFIHGIKIADFETKLSKGKNLNSSGWGYSKFVWRLFNILSLLP